MVIQYVYFVNKITSFESLRTLLNKKDLGEPRIQEANRGFYATNRVYTSRMTKQALELLQKALTLPEADRAALAGSLLESLDQVVDADAEIAWQSEVSRRISDLDSGKAKTAPWEELRSSLAARLANGK